MKPYIIDASVMAKWLFEEPHSDSAARLLDSQFNLHAPDLLHVEVTNVICTNVRRKVVSWAEGETLQSLIAVFPIQVHPCSPLLKRAYAIATAAQRSVYDSLYVALAESLDGRVVTADRRLHRAMTASRWASRVLGIEDLPE